MYNFISVSILKFILYSKGCKLVNHNNKKIPIKSIIKQINT